MNNSQYNTNDIKKKCETKLYIKFKCKKECNGWYRYNSNKITRITIPKGKKNVPKKTYSSMAKQLKLTIKQFDDFLKCTIDMEKYNKILENQNFITIKSE